MQIFLEQNNKENEYLPFIVMIKVFKGTKKPTKVFLPTKLKEQYLYNNNKLIILIIFQCSPKRKKILLSISKYRKYPFKLKYFFQYRQKKLFKLPKLNFIKARLLYVYA